MPSEQKIYRISRCAEGWQVQLTLEGDTYKQDPRIEQVARAIFSIPPLPNESLLTLMEGLYIDNVMSSASSIWHCTYGATMGLYYRFIECGVRHSGIFWLDKHLNIVCIDRRSPIKEEIALVYRRSEDRVPDNDCWLDMP